MSSINNPWLSFRQYEEKDANRFKGRDEDIKNLFHLVDDSDISVLYAESGIGKSSLVNAGIVPNLRGNMYLPIPYVIAVEQLAGEDSRLAFEKNIKDQILSEIVRLNKNLPEDAQYKVVDDFPGFNDGVFEQSLWWFLRAHRILSFDFEITPVILFDQFEEIFKLPGKYAEAFFELLQELSIQRIPERLIEECQSRQLSPESIPSNSFKILFSLREEYVGQLDYWGIQRFNVPALKNNRYSLQPLTNAQALEIIKNQGVNTLDNIADIIVSQSKETGKEYISTLILSVLCSKLYDLAPVQSDGTKQAYPYGQMSLSTSAIIGQYYNEIMEELGIRGRARKVIESTLVSEDGKRLRVPVSNPDLRRIFFAEDYLEKLDRGHLIKQTEVNNVLYVELVHDKVAEVVAEGKRKIMASRTRRRSFMASLVAATAIIIGSVAFHLCDINKWGYSRKPVLQGATLEYSGATYSVIVLDDSVAVNYVFTDCPNLQKVIVKKCSKRSSSKFLDCPNLTEIVLGEGMINLESVNNCPKLGKIYIPSTVEIIGFEDGDKTIFNISPANKYFYQADGVLWELKDKWQYIGKTGNYEWSEIVGKVWDIKFAATTNVSCETEQIKLKTGVKDTILTRYSYYVKFPEECKKEEIEYQGRVFRNRNAENNRFLLSAKRDTLLKVRSVPDSLLDFKKYPLDEVRIVAAEAAKGLNDIKYVDFSGSKVEAIGKNAFEGCRKIRKVQFSNDVSIGNDAFKSCSLIDSLFLKDVRALGFRAFAHCEGLQYIELPDSISCPSAFYIGTDSIMHCEAVFSQKSIYEMRDSIVFDSKAKAPIFTNATYHTYQDSVYCSIGGILFKEENIKKGLSATMVCDIPRNADYKQLIDFWEENGDVYDYDLYLKHYVIREGEALVETWFKNVKSTLYTFAHNLRGVGDPINPKGLDKLRELHLLNYVGGYLAIIPKAYRQNITVFVPRPWIEMALSSDASKDYKAIRVEPTVSYIYHLYKIHFELSLPFIAEYKVIFYPLLLLLTLFLVAVIIYKVKNSPQGARDILIGLSVIGISLITWYAMYWALYPYFCNVISNNWSIWVSNLVSIPVALTIFLVGMSQVVTWRHLLRKFIKWLSKSVKSVYRWVCRNIRFVLIGGVIIVIFFSCCICYVRTKHKKVELLKEAIICIENKNRSKAAEILFGLLPKDGRVSKNDTTLLQARILFQEVLNGELGDEYPYHYAYFRPDKKQNVIEVKKNGTYSYLEYGTLRHLMQADRYLGNNYFIKRCNNRSDSIDSIAILNIDSTLVGCSNTYSYSNINVSPNARWIINPITDRELEIRNNLFVVIDTLRAESRYDYFNCFNSSGSLFKRELNNKSVEVRNGDLTVLDTLYSYYSDVRFFDTSENRYFIHSCKDSGLVRYVVRDETNNVIDTLSGKNLDSNPMSPFVLVKIDEMDYEIRGNDFVICDTLRGCSKALLAPKGNGIIAANDSTALFFDNKLRLKKTVPASDFDVRDGYILIGEKSKEKDDYEISIYNAKFRKIKTLSSTQLNALKLGEGSNYILNDGNILDSHLKKIGQVRDDWAILSGDYIYDTYKDFLLLLNPSNEQWQNIVSAYHRLKHM